MEQLNSMASMLQRLTDQQLQQEMQSPSGSIPQFLLLSEAQRRQAMRVGQQTPVNTTPVAQQVRQQMAQQGIAATPQMTGNSAPPGAGGIQSFADGGKTDVPVDQGGPGYFERMFSGIPGALKGLVADYASGQPQYVAQAPQSATVPQQPAPVASDGSQIPPAVQPGGPINNEAALKSQMGLTDGFATMPGQATPSMSQLSADIAAHVGQRGLNPGGSATGVSRGVAAPGGIGGSIFAAMPVPPVPDPVAKPNMENPSDELSTVSAAAPDPTQGLLDNTEKRIVANGARKNQAFNMALMQAGLGMMASKSHFALQSIGEGGIQGLQGYTTQMNDIRAQDNALQQHNDALLMAQQAAKLGQYKTAADIANSHNANTTRMYGSDIQQRGEDSRMRQGIIQANANMVHSEALYGGRQYTADARSNDVAAKAGTAAGNQSWKQDANEASQANTLYKENLANIQKNIGTMMLSPEQQQAKAIAALPANYRRHITGMDQSGGVPSAAPGGAGMQAPKAKRFVMGPDGTMTAQ